MFAVSALMTYFYLPVFQGNCLVPFRPERSYQGSDNAINRKVYQNGI
jgi:hypothetical protein